MTTQETITRRKKMMVIGSVPQPILDLLLPATNSFEAEAIADSNGWKTESHSDGICIFPLWRGKKTGLIHFES